MSKLVRESISFERGGDPRKTLNVGRIARLRERYNETGLNDLLFKAARSGNLDDVKFLVQSGADVQYSENRPLRAAGQYGHLDVIKYLVELGADIQVNINYNLTQARDMGHQYVVDYLKSVIEDEETS